MIKILFIVLSLTLAVFAGAQTLSPNVMPTNGGYLTGGGNSLSATMGQPFNATLSSANNKLTQGFQQPEVEQLSLVVFLQGYYTGSSTMMTTLYNLGLNKDSTATDTITVNLWSAAHLMNTNPDYSAKAILHKNGTAVVNFPGKVVGNSFYVAVQHRNHLETWSSNPVTFSGTHSYNFSNAATQAYGSNMPNMGSGVYAIYAGDLNHDGGIDGPDFLVQNPDIQAGAGGYLVSDANGSGATDGIDFLVIYPNIQAGVGKSRP